MPEVRLINADGSMAGVVSTAQARALAEQQGLDLVEISPTASPPVCRIMDFGKYKYEQEKKEKVARKSQSTGRVKEVKFHANVEEHDFQVKVRNTRTFIGEGHRVKISLMLRGRENAHQELGFEVLNRVMRECEDVAIPEQVPQKMGRTLYMMLGPKRNRTATGATPAAPGVRPPIVTAGGSAAGIRPSISFGPRPAPGPGARMPRE